MDIITKDTVIQLINECQGEAVSIYLPTFVAGPQTKQNPIRTKNLLKSVKSDLLQRGISDRDAREYLEPINELINDEAFWQEQTEGLALFLDRNNLRYFQLPEKVDEIAVVDKSFYINPLIPLSQGNGQFYLLSIAQETPKLFYGSKYFMEQIEKIELPDSLQKMFDQFFEVHDHLNFHTKSASPNADLPGSRDGMHFGQGGDNINEDAELKNFFHRFDDALMDYIGSQSIPLVLAGLGFLHPVYKAANTYPYLIDEGITKDVTMMSNEDIHKKAWDIVKDYYQLNIDNAIANYNMLKEKNGQTTDKISSIVSDAWFKHVKHLFVVENTHIWGTFDPDKNVVSIDDEISINNQDLLNLAAIHTIINGGSVMVVPKEKMPGKSPAIAILRY
jgi:hypothetical protein